MSEVSSFRPGGYRYLKAVFQYSSGVAAEPGFAIERVHFVKPLPLLQGFAAVEKHFAAIGRPTQSFCACELRSPAPFSEQGFTDFNRDYVKTLERWGIYRDGDNPVARTNVCPETGAPPAPALHAFSYTVPAAPGARPSFVLAGGGELRGDKGSIAERVVAYGDTSPAGLRQKMRHVVAEMERRLTALGFGWPDALATQVYSACEVGPLLAEEIVRRGAAPHGLTWHFCRPPVTGIDYEMDVRAPAVERVV